MRKIHLEEASTGHGRPWGDPRRHAGGARRPGAHKRRQEAAAAARSGGDVPAGYRVAELYFERRGARSIVGNIYKGKVDNVLPGLEAAFVDIGLEKNGFLHVDEIVLPGVEQVKRGRGNEAGPRITDLLKPGQEIVVQVVKDPLKTKGARLSMELTIAGRYMVYAPDGRGRRRLAPARRQGARPPAQGGQAARPRRRRRDHPHRGARRQARGLRARAAATCSSSTRCSRSASRRRTAPGAGLPGGRPLGPRRARHLLRALRARDRRRPQAAPAARLVLHAHRAGARRPRRAVGGATQPLFEAYGVEKVIDGHALAPRRPAQRRLPDHRLRRGADGHRRQLRLVHRPRQGGPARGHDHQDEPRGGRGGRQPAAAARHRRHHRHRLHRHGPRAQPRRGAQDAAQGARRGPHEDLRGRDLAARPGRDDAPERHRRRARDHDQAVPDLRRRGRGQVRGDDRDRGRAPSCASWSPRPATTAPRRSSCGSTRASPPSSPRDGARDAARARGGDRQAASTSRAPRACRSTTSRSSRRARARRSRSGPCRSARATRCTSTSSSRTCTTRTTRSPRSTAT